MRTVGGQTRKTWSLLAAAVLTLGGGLELFAFLFSPPFPGFEEASEGAELALPLQRWRPRAGIETIGPQGGTVLFLGSCKEMERRSISKLTGKWSNIKIDEAEVEARTAAILLVGYVRVKEFLRETNFPPHHLTWNAATAGVTRLVWQNLLEPVPNDGSSN